MAERPYSRYTRARTWAALHSQHIHAGYALVPYSSTNNSIDVISCKDPKNPAQNLAKDTQDMENLLLQHAEECANYYAQRKTPDAAPANPAEDAPAMLDEEAPVLPAEAPAILAEAIQAKRLRSAVVLARSHDYYHYSLQDYPDLKLVICGLHDSYLHLPVWEMRTNQRYKARETAVAITSPAFDRIRQSQFGHHILVAAMAQSDPAALAFFEKLPLRTRSRINREKGQLQGPHYRGRPLAFLTEAKRREIGSKISEGLRRYHDQRRFSLI